MPTDASIYSMIFQGGAFMLVAYIVIYLLPQQAKEARQERESRDKMYADMIDALHGKFDERNDKIERAIRDQTVTLKTEFVDSAKLMREAVANACKRT